MRYHGFSFMSDIMEVIALIILVAMAVYLGYIIFTKYFKDKTTTFSTHRALTILAERYAKGEISDDEYELKKMKLSEELTVATKKNIKKENREIQGNEIVIDKNN